MRRIELNITDVLTTDDSVIVHGTVDNSNELVEIVIPIKQIPTIVGVLDAPTPKKGGK